METVFLTLLNMSITASWLVPVILLIRWIFRKAPKAVIVLMWALVAYRLICPFSVESIFSLIPTTEPIAVESVYTSPEVWQETPAVDSQPLTTAPSATPVQTAVTAASTVWIVGMALLLGYTAVSYIRIHRKVREAMLLTENVWLCDGIDTPFILGIFRPRIFLPSSMCERDRKYVLAHERAHIQRFDHVWKPLGFGLLTVYCFNPVIWIAYIVFCKDIEFACDEKVMQHMGEAGKKQYADALINCSAPRHLVTACPLAFGEVAVKDRIRSILRWRKPTVWIIAAAVIVCLLAALCFLTDPYEAAGTEDTFTEPSAVTTTTTAAQTHPETVLTFTTTSTTQNAQTAITTTSVTATASTATTTDTTATTTTAAVMTTTVTAETTKPTVASTTTAAPTTTRNTTTTVPTAATTTAPQTYEYLRVKSVTPSVVMPGQTVQIQLEAGCDRGIEYVDAMLFKESMAYTDNFVTRIRLVKVWGTYTDGLYVGSYTIPSDAQAGPWVMALAAGTGDGDSIMRFPAYTPNSGDFSVG